MLGVRASTWLSLVLGGAESTGSVLGVRTSTSVLGGTVSTGSVGGGAVLTPGLLVLGGAVSTGDRAGAWRYSIDFLIWRKEGNITFLALNDK